jgi:Fe-S-cluster containining protein
MSDRRTEFGFERTVCDCEACKLSCRFIPGFLVPSDLQRIAEHLGYSSLIKFAIENLLASPGALVMDRGKIRRIRTLVTARRDGGACLFLDVKDRCRIHSVSQFGCSFFDTHQTKEVEDRRSSAGHYQVDLAWKNKQLYAQIWLLLNALGRVTPPPEVARARMRAAMKNQDSSLSTKTETNSEHKQE